MYAGVYLIFLFLLQDFGYSLQPPRRGGSNVKGYQFYFLFAITVSGVVPCGGLKVSPYINHSADYIFLLVL